jgi:hypothetical protein
MSENNNGEVMAMAEGEARQRKYNAMAKWRNQRNNNNNK